MPERFKDAATRRSGSVRDLIQGRQIPPVVVPSGSLRWAPPTLESSPIVFNVTNSNRQLGENANPVAANRDILVNMPSTPITGTVYVIGGRHVKMIGGEIHLPNSVNCAVNNPGSVGLHLGAQTGTVHLEGLWIHGLGVAQPMIYWALGGRWTATVQMQNCRLEARERAMTDGVHTDGIQLYAGPNRLNLYQNTIVSQGVGLQLQTYDQADDAMPTPAGHHFERLNILQLAQSGNCINSSSGQRHQMYALWKSLKGVGGSQTYWPTYNKDCWVNLTDTTSEGTYGFAAWADGFNGGSDDPHWGGWNPPGTGPWAGKITGESWNYGTPPGVDYVPSGTAGIGYVSPGYP